MKKLLLLLALLWPSIAFGQGQTINQWSPAAPVQATDLLAGWQSSSVKITAAQLASYINGQYGTGVFTAMGLPLGTAGGLAAFNTSVQAVGTYTVGDLIVGAGATSVQDGKISFFLTGVCSGTGDDSTAINAALTSIRTTAQASITNSVSLFFPNGSKCAVSHPLNFTGFTNRNLTVNGNGATIYATISGGNVVDALGSIGIIWNNLHIIGDATTEPAYGLVIGRVASVDSGGSGMIFNQLVVTGAFTQTACYNFSGEGTSYYDPQCVNADNNGYGAVFDGFNHFNITSTFVTETAPIDTAQSFNQDVVVNAHFKATGSTNPSALWWGGGGQHRIQGYVLNQNNAAQCTTIYNEAVNLNSGLVQDNLFDLHCEGTNVTDEYLISGNVTTPVLYGLQVRERIFSESNSVFKLGGSVISTSCQGCLVSIAAVNSGVTNTARMFDAPQNWSSWSGSVFTTLPAMWNEPNSWSGSVTLGANTWNYPDRPGPLDILGSSVGAWSSARRLGRSYTGPIINIKNNTSSATADIYADQASGVPLSAISGLLVTGATGNFVTEYDQSGSTTGNLTQGTTASQPTDTIQLANLGSRNVAQFGDAGVIALPSASTLSGLFTSGGFTTSVVNQTGTPTQPDRIWFKTNAQFQYNAGSSAAVLFTVGAATTNGSWITPALANGGHVVDLQYNAGSNANVPTIGFDGVSQSLTPTQPVGAISADVGTVIVGNSTATAGTRGFPGAIAEMIMWKSTPAVNVLDAIRRNQAGFYGLTSVQ